MHLLLVKGHSDMILDTSAKSGMVPLPVIAVSRHAL